MQVSVSVIIPIAPGERISTELETQLLLFPENWEILICSMEKPSLVEDSISRFRWVQTQKGRANSLNEGAKQALGVYLWFLHADSILIEGSVEQLSDRICIEMQQNEAALYYFDLKFFSVSHHFLRPKEIGVLFRSRCLHTPFGDQGFFMKKELFDQYGPYSIKAAYGEDHLFVRELRRKKINLIPIGMSLYTSARKYDQNGWTKTTILHQHLWLKQAFEDWAEHRRNVKNENSNRNILQNSRPFSGENPIGGTNR